MQATCLVQASDYLVEDVYTEINTFINQRIKTNMYFCLLTHSKNECAKMKQLVWNLRSLICVYSHM